MAAEFSVDLPAPSVDPQSLTPTERMALTTHWGKYLTDLEQQAMSEALRTLTVPGDALEVGCQGGRWSEMLAKRGWRVTCTDVDEPALRGSQVRIPTATCILVKPEDRVIPCATNSADLLLCIEVFPVIHSDWFVAEAQRVLRPGGVLLGVFMNKRSLRGLFVLLRHKFGASKPHISQAYFYSSSYIPWRSELHRRAFQFVFERGFCWFPFSRKSNSALIPACVKVERALGLQRLPGLSPWVVFVARKAK